MHPSLAGGSLLLSVPGVGLLLSAQMLGLTEGFGQIPSARSLAQRVGDRAERAPERAHGTTARLVAGLWVGADAQAALPGSAVGPDA
ncbi:MAG: hypothetical protein AAF624_16430 [Bacteroidota bacterium]